MRRLHSRLNWSGRILVALAAAIVLALFVPTAAQADQIRNLEYWLSDYGISAAWATTEGAGVTVAVIDTGVDGNIPDLAGAVVGGTDVSGIGAANGETPLGAPADSGHATWVASMLAGRGTGNGAGLIGVAPEASILSVSIALGQTSSTVDSDAQVANGIRWAVDHGATVINLSITRNTLGWPTSWDSAFSYAFAHNVVIVAAAGNRGSGTTEVDAPATIPGVLAVGGVNRIGTASAEASSQGITIGVDAPSEQLLGADPGGGYVDWDGTSGAAPIVSGIVALVQASHPGMSAANVINRIIKTAHPVGTSPNSLYGYGLVDANAAVNATVASVSANPLGSLSQWITMHRRATPKPTSAPAAAAPGQAPSQASAVKPQLVEPGAPSFPADFMFPPWVVLTRVEIPVALVLGFGLLVGLGTFAIRRHFRRGTPKG
jgi:type VII secretion-associated serine protease mycosin